jgi:hypothetical protein
MSPEYLKEFGRKKEIPLKYETEILVVLSRYPELKDVCISFELTDQASVPYGTKPLLRHCIGSKKNRKYIISLLEKADVPEKAALFKNLTSRMRMGVIAHELMHVIQYHFGRLSLIKTCALFIMEASRRKLERAADTGAIEHGFGEELLEHALYIRSIPGYTDKRPAICKDYLQPSEIKGLLETQGNKILVG